MSNSKPTVQECIDAVNYLNLKYDEIQDKTPRLIPDYFIVGKVISNYDLIEIKLMGNIVWDSFGDNRPNILESHPEFEEGNPKPITLLEHLISEMMGIALGIDRMLDEVVGLKSLFEDNSEAVNEEREALCQKILH